MDPSQLVLRDVHLPASPSWWPPAPGWWCVAAAVLLVVAGLLAVRMWRARRVRRWQHWFDQQSRQPTPAAEVAAISALLRRAARRRDRGADRLQGEAWLQWLDGTRGAQFSQGDGRLLLDGGFRRDVDAAHVQRLRAIAAPRFLELMAGKQK